MQCNNTGLDFTSAEGWIEAVDNSSSFNSTAVDRRDLPTSAKAIYISISLFGFASNIFVVIVIGLNAAMLNQLTNIFIINHSVIDAVAAAFLFFSAVFFRDSANFVPGHGTEEALCRIWHSMMPLWGCLISSTYGIMILTLEKFLAVVYPIKYRTSFCRNRSTVGALLVFPWIIGISYNAATNSTTASISSEGNCVLFEKWPNIQTKNGVGILTVVVEYFIPFFFLVFCYSKMVSVLHRRVEPGAGHDTAKPGGETKRNESMARARGNAIKTLIIVGALFVVCWTLNIFYLLFNFLGLLYIDYASEFYSVTVYMVFLSCCVNPVIYAAKYRQFQKAVRRLFFKMRIDDELTVTVINVE